jgi:tetratricopeptide (TPR) repeat protein
VLEIERGLSALEPERSWLLVALAAGRCGRARVMREAESLPGGDVGDALRALAAEDPESGLEGLSRRLRTGGGPWAQLAAAVLRARLGDAEAATLHASRAAASGPTFVRLEAHLIRARLHMEEGRLEAAIRDADDAEALEPADSRPTALLSEAARRAGKPAAAAAELVRALAKDPLSESHARRLADLLREPEPPGTWSETAGRVAALDLRGNAEGTALRGLLAERAGRASEAVDLYRRALAEGAVPIPVDRSLRHLLAATGRYAEAVPLLVAAIPPDVLSDPRNQKAAAWVELREAARAAPDPSAPPSARLRLAKALVATGALEEARSVASRLGDAEGRALASRLEGELRFEEALHALVEEGYRAALRKDPIRELGAVLADVRDLARRHLPPGESAAFEDPARGRKSVPFLGSWLDHSTSTSSPVVRHFRGYGKYLMLGQRGGLPVEAILLSLASLTERQPILTRGRRFAQDVAVGYDRTLRSFLDAEGGNLGGASLADGVWLDADSARRTDHELRRGLARDPGLLAAARASPAPEARTVEGPYDLSDPACVGVRLLARYVERNPSNPWGTFGTLRAHEFGHVYDIRRHLPLAQGLPATLSLFARAGFSTTRVEMGLEGRAQLAAVADAPDPDLALAEMVLPLPVHERVPEVHDGGYRDAVGLLIRHVRSRPDLYPRIDPALRVLPQLDRLTNDEIRGAARAVLARSP